MTYIDETSGILALLAILAAVYIHWRWNDRRNEKRRNRNYKGGAL